MAERSATDDADARYRDPPRWPQPAQAWDAGDLVGLVVEWISVNRYFIASLVRGGGAGWDAGDVISRMAWRALRRGGLARSLQAHVDGVRPIDSPKAILRYHALQMIGECRRESSQRHAHELPTANVPDKGSYGGSLIQGSGASPDGYQQVIDALTDEALDKLGDEDLPPWIVRHAQDRIPALWKIFCRTAPTCVVQALNGWSEEHRQIVLLAIFPLRLPHRAVANYRRLAWPVRPGVVSEATTQRQIARLRVKLRQLWPSELAPPQVRKARSDNGNDGTEAPR